MPSSDASGGRVLLYFRDAGTGGISLSGDEQASQEMMRRKLAELRSEHRDLDDVIARISDEAPFDSLQVQRLKKRKLDLKDQILKIENELLPDIIA